MSTPRRLFTFLAAALVLSAVGRAEAQTTPPPLTGSAVALTGTVSYTPTRSGTRLVNQINYNDCITDEVVNFPLALTSPSTYTLEAWVGTGCTDMGIRTSTTQTQCWLVARQAAATGSLSNSPVLQIPVQSIIYGYTAFGGTTTTVDAGTSGTGGTSADAGTSGSGGTGGTDTTTGSAGTTATGTTAIGVGQLVTPNPAYCVQPNPEDVVGGTNVTVFFMLIDPSSNNVVGTAAQWTGTFKLVGPPPPDSVSAGIGGNLLVVSFGYNAPPTDQTVNGYNFYCDPPPGGAAAADAGLLPPDAGDAGSIIGSCANGTSQLLTQGAAPDPALICGTAQKTAQGGNATGLVNGVPYNVAVAAVDIYDNIGVLSVSNCQVPQPITGFFKAYQDAGGKGGGGFCTFSPRREPLPLIVLLGLASCLVLRRRRVT